MEKIKNSCKLLKESILPESQWEMDDRFNTTMIVFDKEVADSVHENILKVFENQFDSSSIKNASKEEQKLVKTLSGLDSGQLLFTLNEDDIILFGAWWPWGNNINISLRIGLSPLKDGSISSDEIENYLTEWFALK